MEHRKGFTLIEVLVVIAVIAIIAAILFPVFTQAREKARQSTCLSNCKQWGAAFMMYVQDYDELYPLGFGYAASAGGWAWSIYHVVPAGWRPPVAPDRLQMNAVHWSNSVQPYLKSPVVYACPSGPEVRQFEPSVYTNALTPWVNVSYTFNGLLMGYPQAAVATPSRLPLLWEGRGKMQQAGVAVSNPVLRCEDPNSPCRYVPRTPSGCAPGNGGQSISSTPAATMWIHQQGANFVAVDGSAKWRRLGAQIAPAMTDTSTDPFSRYNADGIPTAFWWDGCHLLLFRPDFVLP